MPFPKFDGALLRRGPSAPLSQHSARVPANGRRVEAGREGAYGLRLCPDFTDLERELVERLDGRSSLWVTTPSVARHHGSFLRRAAERTGALGIHVLECSEDTKTMEQALALCELARKLELPRTGSFVAVSGGVASDLVTVAASLFRRGVGHLRVPTTLLGLVDAAVGVKGGLNFDGGKNALGCFHAPSDVLLCNRFLETLPARHLRAGLGEVLKAGMAVDATLLDGLEAAGSDWVAGRIACTDARVGDIVWRSVLRMVEELETNLFEDRTFVRRMDFGHVFSPALEARCGERIVHGEAVAIDIAFSIHLSRELGWLTDGEAERLAALMAKLGLVAYDDELDVELCRSALLESIRHRGDRLLLFLPTGWGQVDLWTDLEGLDAALLGRALARWRSCFA